ncbi:MAG TPA: AMP-binding protein [bacterium]|nr:AMP-binding protein [bacterium]HQI47416.1 AMP-binding protein [bacterium]HQJ63830.1 AMP-binding protein [bacterium]
MLLHDRFLENAARQPEKTALKAGKAIYSYAGFAEAADRLARALICHGVQRGDRVLLYMDNSAETCIAIFAVLLAGGVFVCLNPSTKYEKLIYVLNDCGARVLITQAARRLDLAQVRSDAKALQAVFLDQPDAGEGSTAHLAELLVRPAMKATLPRIIDIDLAALIYTSGSTGNPKGVMMTHLNMHSAVTSITTYLQNTAEDIVLCALPLSFDYGLYQLLMVLSFGGTLILEKDFVYPNLIIQRLLEEKVTGFPGVPTLFALLLNAKVLEKYRFPHLRYISNTAAALPTTLISRLREALPAVTLFSMYGLTECKRVAYLPPEELDRRPNSVGKAMPNCETYIVDENGRPVKPGQPGELVVRGANVMQGYWNLPEETSRALRPGLHPYERMLYSGDIFRQDEEGFLYFIGRKDDIIKCRGEKVSPREVENVLYQFEGVAEAAVLGRPDPVLGEAIVAVVKLSDRRPVEASEIARHCAGRLESFCVPQEILFIEEMPKSGNGKIDKKRIAELLAAGTLSANQHARPPSD